MPLEEEVDLEDNQDYPPKIKLRFTPQTEHPVTSECDVQVVGLEHGCTFTIPFKVIKESAEGNSATNVAICIIHLLSQLCYFSDQQ